jgi:hypothetical protein
MLTLPVLPHRFSIDREIPDLPIMDSVIMMPNGGYSLSPYPTATGNRFYTLTTYDGIYLQKKKISWQIYRITQFLQYFWKIQIKEEVPKCPIQC